MLSNEASLSARTCLAVFLSSLVVFVPPLRHLFSARVQPLLPNVAVMAIFTVGKSLEQTVGYAVEGFQATVVAVLNIALVRFIYGDREFEVYSFLSLLVLLEASAFVAVVCICPAADNAKMFMVGCTAYFMMAFFATSSSDGSPAIMLCMEYLALSVVGQVCAVVAYVVPLPGVRDVHALQHVALGFEAVVDGCSELIMEACTAFLSQGAGEAWIALSRNKLGDISEKLVEARSIVACQHWAPAIALRRLDHRGRVATAVWSVHHEAAFEAAGGVINTCSLLCELAGHSYTQARNMEAMAVRSALSAGVAQVAECAVALLRDFLRTNFQQAYFTKDWEKGAEELLADADSDETRRELRRSARAALRRSSDAASKELMFLSMYSSDAGAGAAERENDASRGDFASARADMAAFLFLVHALAADLLHAEGSAQENARQAAAEMGWSSDSQPAEEGEAKAPAEGEEEQEDKEDYMESSLFTPLLVRKARPTTSSFNEGPISASALTRRARRSWQHILKATTALSLSVRDAFQHRGRVALKVTVSFVPAFATCTYFLGCDSTFVSTVAYVCSYGSQYSGGSLRRAVLRALGIALGVTVGATLTSMQNRVLQLSGLEESDTMYTTLRSLLSTLAATGWVYVANLFYFRGGPYSYVGLCGGFTGMKFILWEFAGGINATQTVMYNMYACLLTTVVEVMILPVDAVDILRSRFAASLAGAAAVLSALVTSEVGEAAEEEPAPEQSPDSALSLHTASEALKCARNVEYHRGDALPDLTNLLKQAGTYEKYTKWRDGYLAWRQQGTKGSSGELTNSSSKGCTTNRPAPDKRPRMVTTLPQPVSASHLLAKMSSVPEEPTPLERQVSGEVGRDFATLAEAFTPAEDAGSTEEILEPIAGVQLPMLLRETAKGAGDASEVFLSAVDPAFTEGVAKIEEMIVEGAVNRRGGEVSSFGRQISISKMEEGEEAARAPGAGLRASGPAAKLDPEAAKECPLLAELLKQDLVAAEPAAAEAAGGEEEPPQATRPVRSQSLMLARNQSLIMAKPNGAHLVSLTEVQSLLDEIAAALAPAKSLYSQAAERLDSCPVDTHAWRLLGNALHIVHLRLQVLARLALRLRHGVCVAELLGGSGEETAAAELVASFGMALAAARAAIVGSAAPSARDAAKLEIRLQDSASTLVQALARRPPQQALAATRRAGVTSEVLAGTAGATLAALLKDASEVLAHAVVLALPGAGPLGGMDAGGGGAGTGLTPKERAASPAGGSPTLGPAKAVLDLPDLTLRLQEIGMYDKYLAWRDGYMRWRGGGAAGAHKEITEQTTT